MQSPAEHDARGREHGSEQARVEQEVGPAPPPPLTPRGAGGSRTCPRSLARWLAGNSHSGVTGVGPLQHPKTVVNTYNRTIGRRVETVTRGHPGLLGGSLRHNMEATSHPMTDLAPHPGQAGQMQRTTNVTS